MSAMNTQISVRRIAPTPLAPTHAAAMLATPSMLMGVAAETMMSVPWGLTSVPRNAATLWDPTPAAVEMDTDWTVMTVNAMVTKLMPPSCINSQNILVSDFQILMNVSNKPTNVTRLAAITLAPTHAAAVLATPSMLMGVVAMVSG